MSVIAYVRVSTEMQTLENQEYEILNYCRKAGLTIDRWVSESVSGTVSLERGRWGKLSARCRGETLSYVRNCPVWDETC